MKKLITFLGIILVAFALVACKPTEQPVPSGTESKTEVPTTKPTEVPTTKPTEVPTTKPTEVPSTKPTDVTEVEYTVTFNSVGGDTVASQSVKKGEKATEPADPSKINFAFQGWYDGSTKFEFDTPVNKDLNLVARFSYLGIDDTPSHKSRVYNPDFDLIINQFDSNVLGSEDYSSVYIDEENPYVRINYSFGIGNNPDDAIWKQAGSQNASAPSYQYLVLRLRGFNGASIEDLHIGFRYDDNHELLVVPLTETVDSDLEPNIRELDGEWHNYVISITDTLDGLYYEGKTGFNDIEASGVMVGFHLMNLSENGSGELNIKEAFYTKLPNPTYPYEGSDYSQNIDYWHGTVGRNVTSYATIETDGYLVERVAEVVEEYSHVVLRLSQESPGTLDLSKVKVAPVFEDNSIGEFVLLSEIEDLEKIGRHFVNIAIPFDEESKIVGYKLVNESAVVIAIEQSFLTYFGEYADASYPTLNLSDILMYDNFNRDEIGATLEYTSDNPVALANDFGYIISYGGVHSSTIQDGYITFDSTGGDFVNYVVHSDKKANNNEYRYLVFKYKLEEGATLDDLRIAQSTVNDVPGSVVYANQWIAGLGLNSIPEDMASYPYKDGDWTYLIVDLYLTPGYSTDFGGFSLYYTGPGLSIDAIFFANPTTKVDETTKVVWANFEGLEEGSADGKVSENQYWANVYGSETTIVKEDDDNMALRLDGTGYSQYHTASKVTGRYLSFDLKIEQAGAFTSFRVGPTGEPLWAKDGQLILANGAPMVVNEDGQWHHYVIDWVASGLEITDTIGFHASDGEIYLLDNIAWSKELPHFDEELVWGTWEWAVKGDANGQHGPNQYWQNNYGSASSFVEVDGNMFLRLDATDGFVQLHTGVMAKPHYISFFITVEEEGSLGVAVGGEFRWNDELIGLDGEPIVLPEKGSSAVIVIDVLKSGLTPADEFTIAANDGAIYLVDNISFQWDELFEHIYPVFEEDFNAPLVDDGTKYWWHNGDPISDEMQLVTEDYMAFRFGSPAITGAKYLIFKVKLAEDKTKNNFRIEMGDGNIVEFDTLIDDGVAVEITDEYQTVIIDLTQYTNINGLQVLGFHINEGGVIIDDLMLCLDEIGYQLTQFTE